MTRFHLFAVALLLLLTPLLMAPDCGSGAGQTQAPPPATLEALLCDYGSNPLGVGQPPNGAPLFVCEVDAEEYKVPGCECPPGVVIPGLLVALEGALPEPADIQKIADDCLEAAIRFKYQLSEEQYSVIVYCAYQGYYAQGPGGPQSFSWDVMDEEL